MCRLSDDDVGGGGKPLKLCLPRGKFNFVFCFCFVVCFCFSAFVSIFLLVKEEKNKQTNKDKEKPNRIGNIKILILFRMENHNDVNNKRFSETFF